MTTTNTATVSPWGDVEISHLQIAADLPQKRDRGQKESGEVGASVEGRVKWLVSGLHKCVAGNHNLEVELMRVVVGCPRLISPRASASPPDCDYPRYT